VESYERTLLKVTIGDDAFIDDVMVHKDANLATSGLDAKTHALARIASLISIDASSTSYVPPIESARRDGATDEQIVGCLVAVMPVLGSVRVASAAPKLGLALGYDVAEALEDSAFAAEDVIG
jgi:4-carboxymuconolactone decarboxylase